MSSFTGLAGCSPPRPHGRTPPTRPPGATHPARRLKPGEQPAKPVNDDILNVPLPNPLPSIGAKVKVTGAYSVTKTVVSDMVSEPLGGVMAMKKLETVEPAPTPAAFSVKKADCGG